MCISSQRLKQAPRAWYECMRDFLITNGFKVGKAEPTLFTKTIAKDLFICQIYVDDLIFRSTNKSTCEEFSRDYGYKLSKVPLLCDNESAIHMADNPVEHSRTKHIDIRYHFLRDHQQKGDIEIAYVNTHNQLADIFTKPLDEKTFSKLRNELNILDSQNFD
jgi:hypothetical protein